MEVEHHSNMDEEGEDLGPVVTEEKLQEIRDTILNVSLGMPKRFRCVFTLRNIGGTRAIDILIEALRDESILLKHEIAYVLGQMGDIYAIPTLKNLLQDKNESPIVRHEAGEALGAIAQPDCLQFLQRFVDDPTTEVSETCQIAVDRINWMIAQRETPPSNYLSVDPAPPHPSKSLEELKIRYLDSSLSLFERYRALFGLRDMGTAQAVEVMCEGLWDKSALFRHEVAYVLGQVQHPAAAPSLSKVLEQHSENPMVRHEAAEALGALISSESTIPLLEKYTSDPHDIVRESCEVATDIQEYYQTDEFQYADGLSNKSTAKIE